MHYLLHYFSQLFFNFFRNTTDTGIDLVQRNYSVIYFGASGTHTIDNNECIAYLQRWQPKSLKNHWLIESAYIF